MKSQDIVVLLKLISLNEQLHDQSVSIPQNVSSSDDLFSVRGLEASLGISKSEISASIKRSLESGLAIRDRNLKRPKPSRSQLMDFITYGLKYVFPAKIGAMQRGIPTSFSAPTLQGKLMSAGNTLHVWPYAKGEILGQSVEPLFKSIPEAVHQDPRLYEYLALVDAIRIGNQRESQLAKDLLREKILKS